MLCDPQTSPAWSDEVDKRDGLGRVDVNTMLYTFLLSISLHHWNQELVSRIKQFQSCSVILAKGTQVLQRRYLGTILERCVGVNSLLPKL